MTTTSPYGSYLLPDLNSLKPGGFDIFNASMAYRGGPETQAQRDFKLQQESQMRNLQGMAGGMGNTSLPGQLNTSPFGTTINRQALYKPIQEFAAPQQLPAIPLVGFPSQQLMWEQFPSQQFPSQQSAYDRLPEYQKEPEYNPLESVQRSMFGPSNQGGMRGYGGGSGGGGNSSAIPLEGKIGIVKLAQGGSVTDAMQGDSEMEDEILKRAMFAMPLSKEARNTGILSGFEDEMEQEGSEDEDEALDLPRTPQNPEILMNNLRGDMRSVDARYMELAQMVGEEAAMQTPPEVLAMLQTQLAQQAGIGALPQAQGMAPPPMEAPMGGPPLPFPQGGAEQAPPTPDGLPPLRAATGMLVSQGQRLAQMGATGAQNLNQYLGNLLMRPQFGVERMMGGTPPMPLSIQARNALVQGPGGVISYGRGTQFAPAGTLTPPVSPTFTEGLRLGTQQLAQQYPRAADMLQRYGLAAGIPATFIAGLTGRDTRSEAEKKADAEREMLLAQIPGQRTTSLAPAANVPLEPIKEELPRLDVSGVGQPIPEPSAQAATMRPSDQAAFEEANIAPQALATALAAAKGELPTDRASRIRAGYQELAPLFKELLGDDKETARSNALLLLAQAGFKLGTSRQPTAAMAISEAAAELPRGFAAILSQAQDRDIKIRTAALQQAIGDVQEQDKYAQAMRLQLLRGDFELMKKQLEKAGTQVLEDAGAGGRVLKTDKGSFLGFSIDPKDPTVKSAVASRFTLRDTDNPFVENRGEAPTSVETDKSERVKLTSTLRSLDNSLNTLDNLKGKFAELYSPGTWFQDKVNNLLVPISGGLIRPDVKQEDAATQVQVGLNSIMKNIASANDGGRVAVQEQEWVRETAKGINNPTRFFSNKEIAAQQFNSLETILRNARQQVLTQLGYENNDYVMRTPNTGTQSDPFVVSADPQQQKMMYTFLGSTIGKLQDPRATVYLRLPNGRVDAFNPTQLRQLIGQ
jgi:hypothetical protein